MTIEDFTGEADHPAGGSEADLAQLLNEILMCCGDDGEIPGDLLMRAHMSLNKRSKTLETAGIDCSGAVIPKSSFDGALLDGSSFTGSSALACDFSGSRMSGTNFSGCDLRDCDFSGARLSQDLKANDRDQ